ncbi:hypothetical protein F5051DRAFT_437429 [Lentinula edodes]|nr:hypothetical protein F5051DRAFT_437429 [Lentinula edodes]
MTTLRLNDTSTAASQRDMDVDDSTHPQHQLIQTTYTTKDSTKGYISVFQYCLNGYILMMDCDDSYILWTTMWKAVGDCSSTATILLRIINTNSYCLTQVDVMQLLRLRPDLARSVRIVKNGKSQVRGTWLPYQLVSALLLRIAWPFRNQLTPFFGQEFPSKCIPPNNIGQNYDINYLHVTPTNYLRHDRQLSETRDYDTNATRKLTQNPSTHHSLLPHLPSSSSSSCHIPLGSVLGGDPYPTSTDSHYLNQINQSYSQWPPHWDSTFYSASLFSSPENFLAASIPNLEIDLFGSDSSISNQTFVPVLPPISIFEDLRQFNADDVSDVLRRLRNDKNE